MKAKMILSALIALVVASALANGGYNDSSSNCPSYDTTYMENGDRYRQIYINGQTEETYILIKNDTTILYEVDKKKK